MNKICPACNQGKIIRKKVIIPVGRKSFTTEADVCDACGAYRHTPSLQLEIDRWGEAFNKSFIEIQPNLSDVVHEFIDSESKKYSINRTELIRLFTVFYLNVARNYSGFKDIDQIVKNCEATTLLINREKKTISVPIRYRTFKLINRASKVLERNAAQVMEEAVNFCVTLKHTHDATELKQIIAKLDQFIENHALAS